MKRLILLAALALTGCASLANMPVSEAVANIRDGASTDTKPPSERLAIFAGIERGRDLLNVPNGKLGINVDAVLVMPLWVKPSPVPVATREQFWVRAGIVVVAPSESLWMQAGHMPVSTRDAFGVEFGAASLACCCPAAHGHVGEIGRWRSSLKVLRVAAASIHRGAGRIPDIAGVIDLRLSGREVAVNEFPREDVRSDSEVCADAELTVTVPENGPRERMACLYATRSINLRLEAFGRCSMIGSSHRDPPMGSCGEGPVRGATLTGPVYFTADSGVLL